MKLLKNRRALGILVVLIMAATLLMSVCVGCNSKDDEATNPATFPPFTGGMPVEDDDGTPDNNEGGEGDIPFLPDDDVTTPTGSTGDSTTPTVTEPTGSTEVTEPTAQPTEPTSTPTQPTEPSAETTEPVTQPTEPTPPVTEPDLGDTGEGGFGDFF